MSNNTESIICGNIHFSHDAINEMDGERIIVTIPKKEISQIIISFGQSIESPSANICVGLASCSIGLFIGIVTLSSIVAGTAGTYVIREMKLILVATIFIIIGLPFIWRVLRKSHYLLIQTKAGKRKLPLKNCKPSEVLTAATNLGYSVVNGAWKH